jgi:energy-coupling factor transport system permease protein
MYLYLSRDSLFHRLHPVTKILLLLLMVTLPFFTPWLRGIAILFTIYMIMLVFANALPNLGKFWKLMVIFWTVTFVIWIAVPYLRHEPWSYAQAAMLATRIVSFVAAGLLFASTTRIEEFTYGLTRLGVPYKGAFALSLGFRLVPLFYQNLNTIVEAQKSRGVDLDSAGMIQKAKLYLPILSILISYGLRNADLMAMSLEAKGFGYSRRRSSFLQPEFGFKDVACLALPAAAIACLWAWS